MERSWQALDLAERERPMLVLADDRDLCRRLREGAPGRRWDRDVPVIVVARERADPAERVLRARGRGRRRGRPARRLPRARARASGCCCGGDVRTRPRFSMRATISSTAARGRRSCAVCPSCFRARSSSSPPRWRRNPAASSPRRSCCVTCGAIRAQHGRERSTPMRRGCAGSSDRPRRRFVVNVWGVGYRLLE